MSQWVSDKAGIGTRSVASRLPNPAPCHTLFPLSSSCQHTHASVLEAPIQMEKHPTGAPGITVPISRLASPHFRRNQGLQLSTCQSWPPNPSPSQCHPPHKILIFSASWGLPGRPSQASDRERSAQICCHPTVGLWASSFAFQGLSWFNCIMGMLTSAGHPHKTDLNDSVLMPVFPGLILARAPTWLRTFCR